MQTSKSALQRLTNILSRFFILKNFLITGGIFYVFMFLTNGVPYIYSDGFGSFHTANCLVNEGSWVCRQEPEYYRVHRGHGVSFYENKYNTVYAPGSALINLPGQFIAEQLNGDKNTYTDNFTAAVGHTIEEGSAFLITAVTMSILSLYLIYKSLRNLQYSEKPTLFFLTLGFFSLFYVWYIFLNSAYNHNTEILAMSILLYAASVYGSKDKLWLSPLLAGVALGLATLARPTMLAVGGAPAIFYLLKKDWKSLMIFGLSGIPFALLWMSYGYTSYGDPFASSYALLFNQHFDFSSFNQLNILFSPKRGWFIYSPLALLGVIGMFFALRKKLDNKTFVALTGLSNILFTTIIYGFWPYWWGGGSYGQRFLISALPFVVFGLVELFQILKAKRYQGYSLQKVFIVISIALTCWSIFLTGLYRITPVVGLRPADDNIGLMTSGDRYSPFDLMKYHVILVRDAGSPNVYLQKFISSISGGTSYPLIWLKRSNIVLRTDVRENNAFEIKVIPQKNGKEVLPDPLEIYSLNLSTLEIQKYLITNTSVLEELRFECNKFNVCEIPLSRHIQLSHDIPKRKILNDTALYFRAELEKYGYRLYIPNYESIFLK